MHQQQQKTLPFLSWIESVN